MKKWQLLFTPPYANVEALRNHYLVILSLTKNEFSSFREMLLTETVTDQRWHLRIYEKKWQIRKPIYKVHNMNVAEIVANNFRSVRLAGLLAAYFLKICRVCVRETHSHRHTHTTDSSCHAVLSFFELQKAYLNPPVEWHHPTHQNSREVYRRWSISVVKWTGLSWSSDVPHTDCQQRRRTRAWTN